MKEYIVEIRLNNKEMCSVRLEIIAIERGMSYWKFGKAREHVELFEVVESCR